MFNKFLHVIPSFGLKLETWSDTNKCSISKTYFAQAWNADTEWNWEDCSGMYWREAPGCDGWIYWDEWTAEEFFVSRDEFNDWSACH